MARFLRALCLVILMTAVLTGFLELIFLGAWRLSGSTKLDTLHGNLLHNKKHQLAHHRYPKNPKNWLKIATFGGSSANGAAAARNFSNVLEHELTKHFGPKVYVRNYARTGAAFHREQAEIAKAVLPYYDALVIYAGNNEWVNYSYDTGGLEIFGIRRKINAEHARSQELQNVLADINQKGSLYSVVFHHSRLFAIATKGLRILAGLGEVVFGSTTIASPATVQRAKALEPQRSLPSSEIQKINTSYRNDLSEIRKLADQHSKTVVVVGPYADELWLPYFSVLDKGVRQEDIGRLKRALVDAEDAISKGAFTAAENQLAQVLNLYSRHAYANFLMGSALFKMGNPEAAWPYLRMARQEDGFPIRVLPSVGDAAREVADLPNDQMLFVDFELSVRKLLATGASVRDIFAGFVHPSFLGHVMIGRATLCRMSKIERFSKLASDSYCAPFLQADLPSVEMNYRDALGVETTEAHHEQSLEYRWTVRLARISAHPKSHYLYALHFLNRFFPDAAAAQRPAARPLVQKAMFLALLNRPCDEVLRTVKAGMRSGIEHFLEAARAPFDFPVTGYDFFVALEKVGIVIERRNERDAISRACQAG